MKIPIDPANPGEVLACCGMAALAAQEDPLAITGFDGETFQYPDIRLHVIQVEDTKDRVGNVDLDWWEPWGLNPDMDLWAGNQSSRTILRNLKVANEAVGKGQNEPWINVRAPAKSRLGVDPENSWNALTMGWSLNEHKDQQMSCRPRVELLAFIGLQFFALGGNRKDGFTYSLWKPVMFPIARLAFTGHGRFVASSYTAATDKSGKNTILRRATRSP